MKNIFLLGATGSIGTQVLDVVRDNRELFSVVSISFGDNINLGLKIIEEFNVEFVSIKNKYDEHIIKEKFPNVIVDYSENSIINAATYSDKEGVVVNALVGYIGLKPTIEGIKKRRDILIANKETLVCAGEIINKLVTEYNVKLLPIDSEHSAIYQVLRGSKNTEIKRLIITASGGAFRDKTREELKNVSLNDALNHPSWKMGSKITVDCATMVNKGLEIIEAHYLFNVDYKKIETVIHRQSIVHSMVEFIDHSVIAQLAISDMRIPIQYALTFPDRINYNLSESLDLATIGTLNFEKMDFERYPMIELAYKVGQMGGVMPAVYNVSNEVANELFRKGLISFLDIEKIITDAVNNTANIVNPSIEQIISVMEDVKKNIKMNMRCN